MNNTATEETQNPSLDELRVRRNYLTMRRSGVRKAIDQGHRELSKLRSAVARERHPVRAAKILERIAKVERHNAARMATIVDINSEIERIRDAVGRRPNRFARDPAGNIMFGIPASTLAAAVEAAR